MGSRTPLPSLREQAIALRRAGRSRREIQQVLGIRSNGTLNELLRGEPPAAWTRRPNAKDGVRREARLLREQGLAYSEIAAALGVSKSSVSLWVRDLPRPERVSYEASRERQTAGVARYWAQERLERETLRAAISADAARQIGSLSAREVIIAGAIAYWCEGAKNKPHRQTNRVDFINSDPMLIKFFLRFLDCAGISRDRLIFRVSIHQTADILQAQKFWIDVTQADPSQFRQPQIKRHSPRTIRKNTGADYQGCLRVEVRRSMELYRKIEGWACATMSALPAAGDLGQRDLGQRDPGPGRLGPGVEPAC